MNLPDVDGMTPLYIAAHDCHPDMVQKLLLCGADEHAQTATRKTAFMLVLDEMTAKYKPLGATRANYIRIFEILAQRSGWQINEDTVKAIASTIDQRTANTILYYHLMRKHRTIQDGLDERGLLRDVCGVVLRMLYA